MARVVVAEPWLGGSHRAWAEGLARHSTHDVEVVGLPAEMWRWRLRAGAAPLAEAIDAAIEANGEPEVLIVSGLVDVAALLGHLRPAPQLPVVTYMHESQLLYPTASGSPDGDVTLRNWESWRASDEVWFNSAFHRDAVVDALPLWVDAQPESLPLDDVVDRFCVVPVGVEPPVGERLRGDGPPRILWPHRWEPDKAPSVFGRALAKLADAGVDFELILAGDDPADSTDREEILQAHADRVVAVGPFGRDEYERWLFEADIVVSCAKHEFFGVAVVEALMAGCVPVLPAALSYPDLLPAVSHAAALYPVGSFGSRLVAVAANLDDRRAMLGDVATPMQRFGWASVIRDYDDRFASLAETGASSPA